MSSVQTEFEHDDPIRLIAEVIVTFDEGPKGARIDPSRWEQEVQGNLPLAYEIHNRLQVFYTFLQTRRDFH
jgi:hypothetical protein